MTNPLPYPLLSYAGRTVVVTGAATGMGAETVALLLEAGAEVYALDIAEGTTAVTAAQHVDLGDPASIDGVLDGLPPRIDALMHCAGIPGGTQCLLGLVFADGVEELADGGAAEA